MSLYLSQLVEWFLDRRYELIAVVWLSLLIVWFLLSRFAPSFAARFYPGAVAIGLTPAAVTLFMWPGARWPTYSDAFFERAYHSTRPPIDAGASALLFHPGYAAAGIVALYALISAATRGKAPLASRWAYAALLVLFALEELVFFRVNIDS